MQESQVKYKMESLAISDQPDDDVELDECSLYDKEKDDTQEFEYWCTLPKARTKVREVSDGSSGSAELYDVIDLSEYSDYDEEKDDTPENADLVHAAFRSGCNNEVHIIVYNQYLLLEYEPGSSQAKVLDGPNYVFNRFLSLSHTVFDHSGVTCAFGCGKNVDEFFLFNYGICAKIKYEPRSKHGPRQDFIKEGPLSMREMFPCLKDSMFVAGPDTGFGLPGSTEAYLFKFGMYALIDYGGGPPDRKVLKGGLITDLFPCLANTIFDEEGIRAAFLSHYNGNNNFEVYLFEGKYYAILHFDPRSPSSTANIVGGIKEIRKEWACLRNFKPWRNSGKDFTPHLVAHEKLFLVEEEYY